MVFAKFGADDWLQSIYALIKVLFEKVWTCCIRSFNPCFRFIGFHSGGSMSARFSAYRHWVAKASGFNNYALAFYGIVFFGAIVQEGFRHAFYRLTEFCLLALTHQKFYEQPYNLSPKHPRRRWDTLAFLSSNVPSSMPLFGL